MDWEPMDTAPKDGSYILARASKASSWPGRAFVVRHEGQTPSGYDLGWSLFPGYGGASDKTFDCWCAIPA